MKQTDEAGPDNRPRSLCFMCQGEFVAHSCYENFKNQPPENICLWCFSRKPLHDRFMAMYEALVVAVKSHPRGCTSKCCVTARAARKAFKQ